MAYRVEELPVRGYIQEACVRLNEAAQYLIQGRRALGFLS
jgi:hypothetical protein